jgi:hypothetical protein
MLVRNTIEKEKTYRLVLASGLSPLLVFPVIWKLMDIFQSHNF